MNLVDVLNKHGVAKLNSMTKYPSIQTYHEIDRGYLKENLTDNIGFGSNTVYITEKIDGTNGRILVLNGDYIIGSREELLYRKGDIFGNPSQGIVNIMKSFAEHIASNMPCNNTLYVFYGEVYGSNINGAKQYTKHQNSNVRFFDCIDFVTFDEFIEKPIDAISSWREHGGQPFIDTLMLTNRMINLGYKDNIVPSVGRVIGSTIPTNRADTYEWLKQFYNTYATIDEEAFIGRAEGVVVRDSGRKMIRKIRFEDYEKTIKKYGKL